MSIFISYFNKIHLYNLPNNISIIIFFIIKYSNIFCLATTVLEISLGELHNLWSFEFLCIFTNRYSYFVGM